MKLIVVILVIATVPVCAEAAWLKDPQCATPSASRSTQRRFGVFDV
jgi:hypothetical protein